MITITVLKEDGFQALVWAKEYCPSYITNDMHMDGYYTYDPRKIDFYFSEDKDALIFKMKWACAK